MQDFNDYVKNGGGVSGDGVEGMDKNLFSLVNSLASRFDGKSQNDLILAIYEEAKRGKKNGTLTNAEIDNFGAMLSPMLDDKKRKMLKKIIAELKEI
ncbi:MAG: hypothetical protein E7346_01415 [Clostridiales bacterium]|nr:hypothetical protein [Clostridiales bacterium]